MLALLVAPLFIAASAVAHPAVMRRGDVSLSDWSSQNLESYWSFKNRYNSLNCASQSGTDFYTSCCYPLGASESLSDRPAECTPSSLTCSSDSTSSSFPTPTPTPDASSTDDTYDESSLPWCEEGDDGYDDEDDNTYTDASNNGGSTSPDTYTPPATTDDSNTENSQPQPTNTGSSSDNSGNNNSGSDNSGSTNNNNGGSSGANTGGQATYYYQNGNPGACGDYHGDSDFIGAIDIAWYGETSQKSQYCGRNVQITNTNTGQSITIVVADVCPTCDNANSFDLSVGAFQALSSLDAGVFPISWSFV